MRTLLITLAGIATGLALPHADPTQEPPLYFDVQIDGTTHKVAAGKKTTIKIGGTEHQLAASVSPHRHFAASGLQFDYPSETVFEYEEDDGTESWTLTKNGLTLMIHRFEDGGAKMMAGVMINATLEELDPEAKAKPRSLVFGSKTYKGAGDTASMGDIDIDITMIGINVNGKAVVITVQNVLNEDGKAPADSTATMATIQKTFQLTAGN